MSSFPYVLNGSDVFVLIQHVGQHLTGNDWQARMRTLTEMQPDTTTWFDRDVWTNALNSTDFTVTRT